MKKTEIPTYVMNVATQAVRAAIANTEMPNLKTAINVQLNIQVFPKNDDDAHPVLGMVLGTDAPGWKQHAMRDINPGMSTAEVINILQNMITANTMMAGEADDATTDTATDLSGSE